MRGELQRNTHYPLIKIAIEGRKKSCLIDTGFTGDVALGLELARELQLELSAETSYSKVAGNSQPPTKNSQARIDWFGHAREVSVTVFLTDTVGSVDAIIGVHLLVGYILVIDFNEGEVFIKDPALRVELP